MLVNHALHCVQFSCLEIYHVAECSVYNCKQPAGCKGNDSPGYISNPAGIWQQPRVAYPYLCSHGSRPLTLKGLIHGSRLLTLKGLITHDGALHTERLSLPHISLQQRLLTAAATAATASIVRATETEKKD